MTCAVALLVVALLLLVAFFAGFRLFRRPPGGAGRPQAFQGGPCLSLSQIEATGGAPSAAGADAAFLTCSAA